MAREKSARARRKRRRAGKCDMLMMFVCRCDTKMGLRWKVGVDGGIDLMPATELDLARGDGSIVVD